MPALFDVSDFQRRHHLRASQRSSPDRLLTDSPTVQVYNASFDESLAHPAKVHLLQCMEALKEMEVRSSCVIAARQAAN